jgi:hypothetical protein
MLNEIKKQFDAAEDKIAFVSELRKWIHTELSLLSGQPIDNVLWVPVEKVTPNEYNPNSVAQQEMGLLYTSIMHDGYTQPIVTVYNETTGLYEIIDGFHRYYTCKTQKDVRDRNMGMVPIVLLKKSINDRMASTVRHNRARGKHSVAGMSNLVFQMLNGGWLDNDICNELGMEPEELLRLKHITGFSKLFDDAEYRKSWVTKQQIRLHKEHGVPCPE